MNSPTILYDIFIVAGAIQGIFLSIILVTIRSGNRKANLFLGLLLLSFSLSISHAELAGLFHAVPPSPFRIGDPLQLLYGPLLLFYVKVLIGRSSRISWKDAVHLIPAAAYAAVFFFSGGISAAVGNDIKALNVAISAGTVSLMIAYLLAIWKGLAEYRKGIVDDFSNIDAINLNWIRYLMVCFIVFYAVYVWLITLILHYPEPYAHINKIVMIMLSALVYGIGYRGLVQPEILTGASVPAPEPDGGKYLKSSIDSDVLDRDFERLRKLMGDKKPHTNIDLRLSDLAGELGMSNHTLSQIINKKTGSNFYDFINAYRVEEMKALLSDPDNLARFTILGLAHEAGFSSKATFNRFFKRATGRTPSEYVKKTVPHPR